MSPSSVQPRLPLRMRLWQALPAMLLVHGSRSLLALGIMLPMLRAAREPTWMAVLQVLRAKLDAALTASALYLIAAVFLSPFLDQLWLHALVRRRPLWQHARPAFARMGSAVGVTLVCLALALAAATACGTLASLVRELLADSHYVRLRDLAALSAWAPLVPALAYLAALHDHARAALVLRARSVADALQRSRTCTSAASVCWRAAAALLATVLFLFGLLAAPLLAQALALAATCLRGVWLAHVVARVSASL